MRRKVHPIALVERRLRQQCETSYLWVSLIHREASAKYYTRGGLFFFHHLIKPQPRRTAVFPAFSPTVCFWVAPMCSILVRCEIGACYYAFLYGWRLNYCLWFIVLWVQIQIWWFSAVKKICWYLQCRVKAYKRDPALGTNKYTYSYLFLCTFPLQICMFLLYSPFPFYNWQVSQN